MDALKSDVGVEALHGFEVDRLVGSEALALVEVTPLARVVDQDGFGDQHHVVHELLWHHQTTVAIAANDVAWAHQHPATADRLVDSGEGEPTGADHPNECERGSRCKLQTQIICDE